MMINTTSKANKWVIIYIIQRERHFFSKTTKKEILTIENVFVEKSLCDTN